MGSLHEIIQKYINTYLGKSFGNSPAYPIFCQYIIDLMPNDIILSDVNRLVTHVETELGSNEKSKIFLQQLETYENDGLALTILAACLYINEGKVNNKYQQYLDKIVELNRYDGYLALAIIYFIGSLDINDNNLGILGILIPLIKAFRDRFGFDLTQAQRKQKAIKLLFKAYKRDKIKTEPILTLIMEINSSAVIDYLLNKQVKLKAKYLDLYYQPSCTCGFNGGPGFLEATEEFTQLL